MTNPIKAILVGAGGYGETYCGWFLNNAGDEISLAAVIDPYAKNSGAYDRLVKTCPIYDNLEDYFSTGAKADLTIISSPIHLHFEQCMAALAGGSHVFCEKPLVPTLRELNLLEEKAAEVGKTISVGFQWCYSDAIRGLKKRIISGEFGRAESFKCAVCWPRDWAYYNRSFWAGKIKSDDGHIFYDSVVSNATAHYIQNMLFLLGKTMEDSVELGNITIETYRANSIESFDTCVFTGEAGGANIFYAATHAVNHKIGPVMELAFENAKISLGAPGPDDEFVINHKNGNIEKIPVSGVSDTENKMKLTLESIQKKGPLICTPRTVRPFTALIDAIFEQTEIYDFPMKYICKDNQNEITYVENLHISMMKCFQECKLPYELALPWAKRPLEIKTR